MSEQTASVWKAEEMFGCFVSLSCTMAALGLGPACWAPPSRAWRIALGLAPVPSCSFLVLSNGHEGHLNT